jgi:hypothetical protein
MLTKEIIEKGINDTLAEIKQVISAAGIEYDALQKSMDPLQKPELEDENQAGDPAMNTPPADHSEPDGDEGQMPPPVESPIEGDEGDEEESLESSIKQMSDEELDHLMQIVSSEKQSRSAMGTAAGEEGAMQTPPPPAQPNEFEKSIKAEFEKLSKSIEEIKKDVSEVKSAKLQKSLPKPAATNSVTAIEKNVSSGNSSNKKPDRLNKSETIEFALGKIGKGTDSEMIAELNNIQSDEELHKFQDKLERKLGVQLPKA